METTTVKLSPEMCLLQNALTATVVLHNSVAAVEHNSQFKNPDDGAQFKGEKAIWKHIGERLADIEQKLKKLETLMLRNEHNEAVNAHFPLA